MHLDQWSLTLLEVPSPTSSIRAFNGPFVVGKIKCVVFSSNSKHVYITIYCISAQTGQAERDVMNHTSGMNQTAEPLKLTHRTSGTRPNRG